MEDVRRRIPHTIRRNGIYYFQRRVPADLVEAFGLPHLKESLGTSDPKEAERKLPAANARYFEAIDAKRKEVESGASPLVRSPLLRLGALKNRLREYVNTEFVARRFAFQQRDPNRPRDLIRTARAEAQERYQELSDPAGEYTVERMATVAIALFPENQFDQPELGQDHNLWHPINGPFRYYLRWSLLELERRTIRFLEGDPSGVGQPPHFLLQVPAKVSAVCANAEMGIQGITLAELSSARLAEHAKGSVRQQRKEQLAAAHKLILRFFGHSTPAVSITNGMCREFRDLLAELPRDVTKRFGETQPLQEVAIKAKEDGLRTMARATQETYLGALRDMTAWGKHERLLDHDPAESLKSLAPERPRARVDFSDELLKQICLEPFMRKWDRMDFSAQPKGLSDATRFWVPRVGLFSGMRQNEICQLDVADVRSTNSGTAYILVDDEGLDKQIKNSSSRRAVPIHARLIEAGFLDFVKSVKSAGNLKLFPELERSNFGHYGEKLSKWITRQMRSAGYGRGVDFHAFRHTFAQALRYVDAPTIVAARLGGWTAKSGGVMDRYGGALSDKWIDHLNVTLQKIDYGVANDHIF